VETAGARDAGRPGRVEGLREVGVPDRRPEVGYGVVRRQGDAIVGDSGEEGKKQQWSDLGRVTNRRLQRLKSTPRSDVQRGKLLME
jgi:hypothetical protein